MRFFYISLFYFIVINLNAHDYRLKPGKVPKEDLQAIVCPIDSTANAFIIFDRGNSYIEIDPKGKFELIHKREVRVKVLNMKGADIANWSIPLFKNNDKAEEIYQVKVNVYNLIDGKEEKTRMDKGIIHEEDVNPQFNLVKFAIPGVQEGSIIDIEYSMSSPFYYNFQPWEFQGNYPVLISEYRAEIPDFFEYNTNIQGYIKVKEETVQYLKRVYRFPRDYIFYGPTSYSDRVGEYTSESMIRTFIAKNVAVIREEPMISSLRNFVSRITFELSSMKFKNSTTDLYSHDWNQIDKMLSTDNRFGKLLELSQHSVKSNSSTENIINELNLIYHQTRASSKWNHSFSIYSSEENLSNVQNGKEGNSGDININFIRKCRLAGLKVYPVLCSTRKNGFVFPHNPSINQFNHIIAAALIDSQLVLMDLTGINNIPGILPFHTLNGMGRLIIDNKGKWINLQPNKAEKDKYFFQIKYDEDNNELDVTTKWELQDNSALEKRNYLSTGANNYERLEILRKDHPSLDLDSLYLNEAPDRNFSIFMTFRSKTHIEKAGEKLIVNSFFMNELLEDPFLEEDRLFPIEPAYPLSKTYNLNFQIPEGYELPTIPEPMHITIPDNKGDFIYKCQAVGNQVQLIYTINLNDTYYPATDYPVIRQFFNMILEKANEPLVLVKS